MCPAREDLLMRTFEAVKGAKHVALQLYSATAPIFREVILKLSEQELIEMAIKHVQIARKLSNKYLESHGTSFRLVYGLESFSQSNMDFVIQICSQVQDAWNLDDITPDTLPVVFNLAATVECATPNHFADQVSAVPLCYRQEIHMVNMNFLQVEYFRRNMSPSRNFVIGVHTHNDRGQ